MKNPIKSPWLFFNSERSSFSCLDPLKSGFLLVFSVTSPWNHQWNPIIGHEITKKTSNIRSFLANLENKTWEIPSIPIESPWNHWLVVSTPLKNMSQLSQLGLLFPIWWENYSQYDEKNTIHVPNHQSESSFFLDKSHDIAIFPGEKRAEIPWLPTVDRYVAWPGRRSRWRPRPWPRRRWWRCGARTSITCLEPKNALWLVNG